MIDTSCTPLAAPSSELEQPDRLPELLACLADLLVETGRQRQVIAATHDPTDPRAHEAVRRFAAVQDSLSGVSAEVAAVHQALRHIHLI